jgi:hypothetical protein
VRVRGATGDEHAAPISAASDDGDAAAATDSDSDDSSDALAIVALVRGRSSRTPAS